VCNVGDKMLIVLKIVPAKILKFLKLFSAISLMSRYLITLPGVFDSWDRS